MEGSEAGSAEPPRVYANFMAAHGGAFDVSIDYGFRIADETPDPEIRVTMSWEHLRATVEALQQLLDRYEDQAGPVRKLTPDDGLQSAASATDTGREDT